MPISPHWANEMRPKYIDYVYCLRSPLSDYEPFYIGRTTYPSERLLQHISSSRENASGGQNKAKAKLIRSIISSGYKPTMVIIDKTEIRCDYDKLFADYKELKWIRFYLEIGWPLTNIKEINRSLDDTNFATLKAKIIRGESLSASSFYYGTDSYGREVYDIQKVLRFGYKIPESLVYEEKERYTYENVYNEIPEYL